jgi:hypothetical protein
VVYNFTRSGKALRSKIHMEGKRWFRCSSAMAAGLTDHLWSIRELLMLIPIPTNSVYGDYPGILFRFKNLLHPRPVQTDHPRDLAVAHAAFVHSENISAELGFIRVTQIAFG